MNNVTGLAFRKVDLHIHTPKSACYSDKSVTPEQIVEAALASGLDTIAITDHNSVEGINEIRQVAREKGLSIFPGIELSTKGGHVIALFEPDTVVESLQLFLDHIGIAREGWGDAITLPNEGMEKIIQRIDEWGGLAIAAHIERWPSGFLETNESRRTKTRIHASKYLSALEITVAQNRSLWNEGQARGYPKQYACIQSSDAHALVEIGRRPVYIQMETVCLECLREAFLNHETRIIFPDDLISGK